MNHKLWVDMGRKKFLKNLKKHLTFDLPRSIILMFASQKNGLKNLCFAQVFSRFSVKATKDLEN